MEISAHAADNRVTEVNQDFISRVTGFNGESPTFLLVLLAAKGPLGLILIVTVMLSDYSFETVARVS